MAETSIDLRRRLVEAYRSKKSGTYAATAALFGVGEATVSRLLRRQRETGDVQHKTRGGNRKREIDLVWLRENLTSKPDDRLIDRIGAWQERAGKRVSLGTMWLAVRACGWTHKKKQWSPANKTAGTSKRSERRSSPSKPSSTRRS